MAMDVRGVTVVLRCMGERTEGCARRLLEALFPAEQILRVREVPFSAALRKGWQEAVRAGRPWTLCTDADVLIRAGGVRRLLEEAAASPESVFELQGRILDKLFGGPRPGGPHLFRTFLLSEGMRLIPSEEESKRPETFVLRGMEKRGHPFIQLDMTVGIHDYEQSYRDLIRKGLQHSRKHTRHGEILLRYWDRLSVDEPDFKAALRGLRAGLVGAEPSPPDDMAEKEPLAADAWNDARIEKAIADFEPPPEYDELMRLAGSKEKPAPEGLLSRLRGMLRQGP